MSVASLAARAVAAGPPTLSPPSFEGHDWLYILNLFVFFAGTQLCVMFCGKFVIDKIRCLRAPADSPDHDEWTSPIMLLRRIGMLISGGMAVRCFSEMQSLWRWYPLDPVGTGRGMALKRILDPVAFGLGITGLLLLFLALPGLTEQLRKRPFPVDMWTSLPLLKRPGGVVLCCLGAAIAVVAFR